MAVCKDLASYSGSMPGIDWGEWAYCCCKSAPGKRKINAKALYIDPSVSKYLTHTGVMSESCIKFKSNKCPINITCWRWEKWTACRVKTTTMCHQQRQMVSNQAGILAVNAFIILLYIGEAVLVIKGKKSQNLWRRNEWCRVNILHSLNLIKQAPDKWLMNTEKKWRFLCSSRNLDHD